MEKKHFDLVMQTSYKSSHGICLLNDIITGNSQKNLKYKNQPRQHREVKGTELLSIPSWSQKKTYSASLCHHLRFVIFIGKSNKYTTL